MRERGVMGVVKARELRKSNFELMPIPKREYNCLEPGCSTVMAENHFAVKFKR